MGRPRNLVRYLGTACTCTLRRIARVVRIAVRRIPAIAIHLQGERCGGGGDVPVDQAKIQVSATEIPLQAYLLA